MEHSAGKAPRMKQRIALLGSTGSIGVQTLDIVRENSELFEITTLTAHRNWEALARQAEEFAPDSVVIADDSKYDALRRALADDDRIVQLRRAVREAAESKLRNGVIDTNDLLRKITEEATAATARSAREIELVKTIYELKHTINR